MDFVTTFIGNCIVNTFIRTFLIITAILFFNSNSIKAQKFVWAHNVSGGDMFSNGISTDKNGNSYTTGCFRNILTFGNHPLINHGDQDIYIAKYDSTGNCLWAKSAGGLSSDWGDAITVDGNGFAYVTGFFFSSAIFDTIHISPHCLGFNMFLAKYDTMGNCSWVSQAASGKNIRGLGVSADGKGNSFVTGYFTDTVILGSTQLISNGTENIFLVKYNSDGNCLWAKQAGGRGYADGIAISTDKQGNSYITGRFEDTAKFESVQLISTGDWDVFVAKYDSSGNLKWAKRAGGTYHDLGNGISVDKNGNCYVTGSFFGPADFGINQLSGFNGYDIFIAKFDQDGNCLWAKQAGGAGYDDGYAISTDPDGNSYITGDFVGNATFGTIQITGSSDNRPYAAKYDNNGNCVWVKQVVGFGAGYGISNDAISNSYISGNFGGTALFDTIQLSGGVIFITKLAYTVTDIKTATNIIPNNYLLSQNYPNPFNPTTTINYSIPKEGNVRLTIYSAIGKKEATIVNEYKPAGNYSVQFNGNNLASGIYLYRLESWNFSAVKKLILIK